ncbi:diguanylate cyclase [Streptomyces alboflavus]|uniref:Diguanylate cyclase n=1 Tax=Streptomyces alboflavus TaxID=67267 RepID=A0A1Z1WR71_9ACTN|nr:diguanylate cyclase [Streptomyces alboflavus]
MTGFLVKRFLQALVVLFLVSIIVFVLLHMLPGGPARAILGPKGTPQQIEQFNHQQGYDRSLPTQYFMYLKRLFTGDLGTRTNSTRRSSSCSSSGCRRRCS